jgi:hypothetical protein
MICFTVSGGNYLKIYMSCSFFKKKQAGSSINLNYWYKIFFWIKIRYYL